MRRKLKNETRKNPRYGEQIKWVRGLGLSYSWNKRCDGRQSVPDWVFHESDIAAAVNFRGKRVCVCVCVWCACESFICCAPLFTIPFFLIFFFFSFLVLLLFTQTNEIHAMRTLLRYMYVTLRIQREKMNWCCCFCFLFFTYVN